MAPLRRDDFDPEAPLASAATPPSSWYTQASVLERERERVFAPRWQLLGPAEGVASPGDFFADAADEPLVAVCDETGQRRVFENVCRHHGAEVARGRGRCGALRCPYHGWTYGLDGRLLRAPGARSLAGAGDVALPERPAAVWGPLLLAGPPDAASFGAGLERLGERLDGTGWQRLRFAERRRYRLACNWKVFVENYLDGGYHVPHLHRDLGGGLELASYRSEVADDHSVQTARVRGSARLGRAGASVLYAWIHPNLMLNRYGPVLDTNLVVPDGPEHCTVVFDFYFDPDLAEPAARASIAESEQVQAEDVAICESVQRGLRSRGYERGRYAPDHEAALLAFHRRLWWDLFAEGD